MRCFARESREQTDNYVTLNQQTQGQQPVYDDIQLNQRQTQRHNDRQQTKHDYENAAAADNAQ